MISMILKEMAPFETMLQCEKARKDERKASGSGSTDNYSSLWELVNQMEFIETTFKVDHIYSYLSPNFKAYVPSPRPFPSQKRKITKMKHHPKE